MNTHGLVCDFDRHRGTPYTRLPASYLKWMVNSGHSRAEIAAAELARRGTVTPDLDVSGHAVDRASLFGLDVWAATRQEGEGLRAWLYRVAVKALAAGPPDAQGRRQHHGSIFAFEQEGAWPELKTVMRGRETP